MSQATKLNNDFLSLIFALNKKQRQILLETLSYSQVDSLHEIFFNLIKCPEISPKGRSFLRRYKDNVTTLYNIWCHRNNRKPTVKRHQIRIINLLKHFDPIKEQIIDCSRRYG